MKHFEMRSEFETPPPPTHIQQETLGLVSFHAGVNFKVKNLLTFKFHHFHNGKATLSTQLLRTYHFTIMLTPGYLVTPLACVQSHN